MYVDYIVSIRIVDNKWLLYAHKNKVLFMNKYVNKGYE